MLAVEVVSVLDEYFDEYYHVTGRQFCSLECNVKLYPFQGNGNQMIPKRGIHK